MPDTQLVSSQNGISRVLISNLLHTDVATQGVYAQGALQEWSKDENVVYLGRDEARTTVRIKSLKNLVASIFERHQVHWLNQTALPMNSYRP